MEEAWEPAVVNRIFEVLILILGTATVSWLAFSMWRTGGEFGEAYPSRKEFPEKFWFHLGIYVVVALGLLAQLIKDVGGQ